MEASRFTPGPWRVAGKASGIIRRDRQGDGDKFGNVDVASVGDYRDKELLRFNKERWDADAALIAAAPDLYEALGAIVMSSDNLLRILDELRERGEVDHWQAIQCSDLAADINIARAALLKAVPNCPPQAVGDQ